MSETAVRERPILFSGPMVREIDEGQGFYGCGNLTESQTGKILKAVAEFRANLDLGTKE